MRGGVSSPWYAHQIADANTKMMVGVHFGFGGWVNSSFDVLGWRYMTLAG